MLPLFGFLLPWLDAYSVSLSSRFMKGNTFNSEDMQQIRGKCELRSLVKVLLVDVIDLLIATDDEIFIFRSITLEEALVFLSDLLLYEELMGEVE
jgi:hypothetical protein